MPRPHKCRRIAMQVDLRVFKPAGVPARDLETVELGLDELEALRLADVEGLYQEAAAESMGVSRPTFGRLIERARHKVASALLGSKMIVFQGGPIMIPRMRTFECAACGAVFQAARGTGRPTGCPQCQGADFHRSDDDRGTGGAGRGCGRRSAAGQGRGRRNPEGPRDGQVGGAFGRQRNRQGGGTFGRQPNREAGGGFGRQRDGQGGGGFGVAGQGQGGGRGVCRRVRTRVPAAAKQEEPK